MKFTSLTSETFQYIQSHTRLAHPILAKLAEETSKMPSGGMQISADQGAFMHLVTKLMKSRRALEIGCFTGYSALAVASALPEDGKLISLDVSEEFTAIAKRYWKQAGLENKIELKLAPALDTLPQLIKEYGEGSFDQAFIDADKGNYLHYYEACLKLVKPGGLIMIDNVIWGGAVADSKVQDADTVAIRSLNDLIHSDKRVETSFLSLSDGLYLVRRL